MYDKRISFEVDITVCGEIYIDSSESLSDEEHIKKTLEQSLKDKEIYLQEMVMVRDLSKSTIMTPKQFVRIIAILRRI